jgi:biotin transporter BioY
MLLSLIVAEVLVFVVANQFERPSVGLMAVFIATLVGVGLIYSFGFAPLERISRAEPAPAMRRTTYLFLIALAAALALVPIYVLMRA